MNQTSSRIPIVTDVIRNIDGLEMVRCSYFSIQSDTPLPDWNITIDETTSPILLLNLEAIIVGPLQENDEFRDAGDIESMYEIAEQVEGLFVDINDIWVPLTWFGNADILQGTVFRISQSRFTICWKLRNDSIAFEDFKSELENTFKPEMQFSETETLAFREWTKRQINNSRELYHENRESYLNKIEP